MTTIPQTAFVEGSKMPALTPGKLRIYSMRFCPFAERTVLVLAHKKIPHETVNINLQKKPEWFLEKNPLGLVPILEQDSKVVYESSVTCEYLDEIYPDSKLTSEDPYQKAIDKMLLERFSKVTGLYYNALRAQTEEEPLENLKKALDIFEKDIGQRGNFFGGDKVAMLDFLFWPIFERIPVFEKMGRKKVLSTDRFPNLAAWFERMLTVPAVKETMHDAATYIKFYTSHKSGVTDYDIGLQ